MPSRCRSIAVAAAVAAAITAARTWLIIDQPPACSSYIRQLLYGSTVTLHRCIFPQLLKPWQRHLQQQKQPSSRSGNTGSITNSRSSTSAAEATRTSAAWGNSSSNRGNINRISRNCDMGSSRGAAARTSTAMTARGSSSSSSSSGSGSSITTTVAVDSIQLPATSFLCGRLLT